MAAIVYLDVDDEITSAAARIRALPDDRIALVLPLGSRLATSRINFRLLAREAESRSKRLEVVTNDASARALAASAGLATHVSVAAFERGGAAPEVGPASGSGADSDDSEPTAASRTRPNPPDGPPAAPDDPTIRMAAIRRPQEPPIVPRVGPARRRANRRGLIVGIAVVIVALVVGGAFAFTQLPSATVTLVPASEVIGPLHFNVAAQRGITQPDPANLLVPATPFLFDVETSSTFPATGLKVDDTPATGTVTFSSLNTGSSNTIPAGSIVKTASGIEFLTLSTVELPPADVGIVDGAFVVIPSTRKVGVEAVVPGESGNVPARSIVVVPNGENPKRTTVSNEQATTGGTHTETPQVVQADVDAALLALETDLTTKFQEMLADPPGIPPGTTVFAATATLGESTPSVDPATLVGSEVAEFQLGASAQGTVLGVDAAPVQTLADARLRTAVRDGFSLDEATIDIEVGEPIVAGSAITFPVTARASETRRVDALSLQGRIVGLGIPQARSLLEGYGTVTIEVWPDWVSTIPTNGRLTFTVAAPGASPSPSASSGSAP